MVVVALAFGVAVGAGVTTAPPGVAAMLNGVAVGVEVTTPPGVAAILNGVAVGAGVTTAPLSVVFTLKGVGDGVAVAGSKCNPETVPTALNPVTIPHPLLRG